MESKLLNKEELYNQLSKYDKNILLEVFDKLIVEYDESELSSEEKLLVEEAREDYKNKNLVEWK